MNFGDVSVGSSKDSVPIEIQNVGSDPFEISVVAVEGDFKIIQNECSGWLDGFRQTCTITVTFSPKSLGPLNGQLTVGGSVGTWASPSLSGTGVAPY